MKSESLVIAGQHTAVNTFPGLVHTARHTTIKTPNHHQHKETKITPTEKLEQLAYDHGIIIHTHPTATNIPPGTYLPHLNAIILRRGQHPTELLYTLAHELGHALLNHPTPSNKYWENRYEREADEWAANHLITTADYLAAQNAVGPHPSAIAQELGVPTRLLMIWRQQYNRRHAA